MTLVNRRFVVKLFFCFVLCLFLTALRCASYFRDLFMQWQLKRCQAMIDVVMMMMMMMMMMTMMMIQL